MNSAGDILVNMDVKGEDGTWAVHHVLSVRPTPSVTNTLPPVTEAVLPAELTVVQMNKEGALLGHSPSGYKLMVPAEVRFMRPEPRRPGPVRSNPPPAYGWKDADSMTESQVMLFDDVTRIRIVLNHAFASLDDVLKIPELRKLRLYTNGTKPEGVEIAIHRGNTDLKPSSKQTELRIWLNREVLKTVGLLAHDQDSTKEIAWYDVIVDPTVSSREDSEQWESANFDIPEADKRGRAYKGGSMKVNGDRPLHKTFLMAGGAQVMTAEFAGLKSDPRQIADQADVLYISSHGTYDKAATLAADERISSFFGAAAPFGPTDAKWDKEMKIIIIGGCSVFGVKTLKFRYKSMTFGDRMTYLKTYAKTDPSPGEKWEVVKPTIKLGYCFSAPLDLKGGKDIAKTYQNLVNEGMDPVAAWGQANGPATKGNNACAIDTRVRPPEYWYFKEENPDGSAKTLKWTKTVKGTSDW